MGVGFTSHEGSALYRMLAENTADIILKTDCDGFIVHASPAIEQLGVGFPMLIGPHILDLVHPSCAAAVKIAHEMAINGREDGKRVEFPALTKSGGDRWFEIQVRRLTDEHGTVYGALCVMRCIEERRRHEAELFAAGMTDSLTGLSNRKAFIGMLRHLVDERVGGCMALFSIDHFRTINMQYGQSVGDEVLVVFADLLRMLVRADDIVSRVGDESLAVLLPDTSADEAEAVCRRIVAALAEIRQVGSAQGFSVTVSAGVSRIEKSLDDTIKRAELALFFAKTKGRNRLEVDSASRLVSAAGGIDDGCGALAEVPRFPTLDPMANPASSRARKFL